MTIFSILLTTTQAEEVTLCCHVKTLPEALDSLGLLNIITCMTCMPLIHELCIRPLYAVLSQYVAAKLTAVVATHPMSMCPSTALSSLCKHAPLCDASLWHHNARPSGFSYKAPNPWQGGKHVSPAAFSCVLALSLQHLSMHHLLRLQSRKGCSAHHRHAVTSRQKAHVHY